MKTPDFIDFSYRKTRFSTIQASIKCFKNERRLKLNSKKQFNLENMMTLNFFKF